METISTKVIHDEVLNIYAKYIFQMIMYCNMNNSNNKKILNNLLRLGAINSSTYIESGGASRETLELIKLYKEKYSLYEEIKAKFPNIIILPWIQFAKLCNKYDLVTDTISNYTGDIPEENIDELIHVRERVLNYPYTSRGFNKLDEKELYRLNRISILNASKFISNIIYSSIERFPIFREASIYSYENILGAERELFNRTGYRPNIAEIDRSTLDIEDILITAPRDKFKKNRFVINSLSRFEYERKIHVEDPLAIQVIDGLGVGVHSKWGEEANDIIFNR